MEPRRFFLRARLGGCALSVMLALAACTDRELPTAVRTAPDRASMLIASEGSGLVSVSAGHAHTCGVKTDGTIDCWGGNPNGQATDPAGTFTQVSAGRDHTCAVNTDGTVDCWGFNDAGQATDPTGTFTQVSAGRVHTCAVNTDGTVHCWGRNSEGQSTDPAGTFTQVSAGGHHTCAVRTDGSVDCWGYNGFGQATDPAGTFTQVSAGESHTCAVRTDGTVHCWGDNASGQSTDPGGTFTQVSAGDLHTCAVKTDGTVRCWGDNGAGQATDPAGTFSRVSAGFIHTCAVKTDGTVHCWGDNSAGQSTPSADPHAGPGVSAGAFNTCAVKTDGTVDCWGDNGAGQATDPAGTFTQVSPGRFHTCAVKTNGTVDCWGFNFYGQATDPVGTFTQVSAGFDHTCAVRTAGTVDCWGRNNDGEATDPAGTFTQVSAEGFHTCAVKTDGTVHCWGENTEGQSTDPAGTFTQVSAGTAHNCAVKTDGTVHCWGSNFFGETTDPTGTFTQVSAGTAHTCAVKTDGTVHCWGDNSWGQSTDPVGTFTQVSAGGLHTCAVKTDGTIKCWGGNGNGQSTVPAELADVTMTTTTLSLSPSTQQYSDKVSLTASVLPTSATGSVQFRKSIDGGANFADLGSPVTVANGSAALNDHQIVQGAPTAVQFQAVFTATGSFTNSTSDATSLTVTREAATIVYANTNVAALQVATPGGSRAPNTLTLLLQVRETSPDLAATTAGLGDIANAGLSVTLAPVGPGSSYALTCTAGAVTGSGYAAHRLFTCKNPAAIAVNAYEVVATVTGDYFTGTLADAFTVYDPSLGFATGGGSFVLGGDKVNFGFTMKYAKNGGDMKGNFIAVRHHADGTVSRLKSNALGSLALGEDASVPMGWVTFNGKATYTKWDAIAGAYVTLGNQSFAVYGEDRDNPGTGIDQIWLAGPGTMGMAGTAATAKTNTAALTGGGVSVPHRAAGGKK